MEAGFTLIELLIVIVVLGVLSGVVVYSLSGIQGQSAGAACVSDAKSVETAVSAYQAQNNGTVPPATNTTGSAGASGASGATGAQAWWSPYLKSWPSNNGYQISTNASGSILVTTSSGTNTYVDGSSAACPS
jgi:prepilin-type N-terminal cleavage/methylation domain-containing protein